MKTFFYLVIIVLSVTIISFPQQEKDTRIKQRNKLIQLEKVKLIDALNLDEETSVRFFARRDEMQKEVEALNDQADDILQKLSDTFDSKDKGKEANQKQLIKDYIDIKQKIENTRRNFITSLSDILPTEKIARYLVFEQKFRDEIRKILFHKNRTMRP